MNTNYWVLGTPDGAQLFGTRFTVREIGEEPTGSVPPDAPLMLFTSEEVAREAIRFFGLPSALGATPWRLETEEQYNDFLAHAWKDGARELMVVESLTPGRMRANLYSFCPAGVPLMRPGTGKSSPLRWLLGPGREFNWN